MVWPNMQVVEWQSRTHDTKHHTPQPITKKQHVNSTLPVQPCSHDGHKESCHILCNHPGCKGLLAQPLEVIHLYKAKVYGYILVCYTSFVILYHGHRKKCFQILYCYRYSLFRSRHACLEIASPLPPWPNQLRSSCSNPGSYSWGGLLESTDLASIVGTCRYKCMWLQATIRLNLTTPSLEFRTERPPTHEIFSMYLSFAFLSCRDE